MEKSYSRIMLGILSVLLAAALIAVMMTTCSTAKTQNTAVPENFVLINGSFTA